LLLSRKRFLEASGYQVRIERRIIDFDPGDLDVEAQQVVDIDS